jgi:UDP-glucose-4-epimerase GalE
MDGYTDTGVAYYRSRDGRTDERSLVSPLRRDGPAREGGTRDLRMAILVTGGAGYIGSHTVRLLLAHGQRVVVLDSLESGHAAAVGDAPLFVGNIADDRLVASIVAEHDVDAVVHFAGYKAAGESMRQPGRYFINNVAGSARLIETLHGCGVGRLVFSSSCAVYGTPTRLPVGEDQPVRPESPYGESKALVERMLGWYDRCHGMRSVSLRYFNAAGADEDGGFGEDATVTMNLVPVVMQALLDRRAPVQVFGTDYPTPDGTAIRDYVHVDDLADAHLRALDFLAEGGQTTTVNFGTGVGSSVRDVLAATAGAAGRPVPAENAPRRIGDPVSLYSDNTLARELLGWEARRDLMDIVASAWRWHAGHPEGYASGAPTGVPGPA